MKLRVFLDTNIFIYAFEFPVSNSSRIIGLLNRGAIEGIISDRVVCEVQSYFKKYYGKDLAGYFRDFLLVSCVVISSFQVDKEIVRYRGRIKEKDLEQLAVTKKLGLKFLFCLAKICPTVRLNGCGRAATKGMKINLSICPLSLSNKR